LSTDTLVVNAPKIVDALGYSSVKFAVDSVSDQESAGNAAHVGDRRTAHESAAVLASSAKTIVADIREFKRGLRVTGCLSGFY